MTEISIFDGQNRFELRKPLRLIELFAGYGSQHLALKYLGVPCESYAISEWAIKSIQAYKDMHEPDDDTDYGAEMTDDEIRAFLKGRISGDYSNPLTDARIDKMKIDDARRIYNNMKATKNLGSVCAIQADEIPLDDEHTYLLTYSFPCQDLSLAGLRKGMDEGSGTRSGLLWEVNRLLHEWDGLGKLPDVLLMENVPEVVGKKNRRAWEKWIANLDSLGYRSYWKILNATDYGIPQNRRRCFMVSMRGDYYYNFPLPIGCPIRLKHVLEPVEAVGDSYYLSDSLIETFITYTKRNMKNGNGFGFHPAKMQDATRAAAILTRAGTRGPDNYIIEDSLPCLKAGDLNAGGYEKMLELDRRVYDVEGAAPTVRTVLGGNKEIKVLIEDIICFDAYHHRDISANEAVGALTTNAQSGQCGTFYVGQPPRYRIRKLIERECFRLMGVRDKDSARLAKHQPKSSMYHLAGDSIVTACLMGIFGELLGVEWESKVQELQRDISTDIRKGK